MSGQQCSTNPNSFLCLVSDPFKNAFKENAFWASLATSVSITFALAILFSLLRPHHSLVYAPKFKYADEKHSPPPISKGILSWVKPILKTREVDLVDRLGLDAIVFLRFTRMCRNLFLIMSLLGCLIMIPVNVASSNASYSKDQSRFTLMTPLYVWGNALWAHIICSYLFNSLIVYFLWTNYRAIVRLRRQHFKSAEYQASLHSRTLMTTDIPKGSQTNDGLAEILGRVKKTSGMSRSLIGRNTKALPELIQEHDDTVRKLESYLAKYLKNPDKLPSRRPTCSPAKKDSSVARGSKVDAFDYLRSRIDHLANQIGHVRQTVDSRDALPYGFTSYASISEAHSVAFAARRSHPEHTTTKLAPKPSDIIWSNLPLSKNSRRWRVTRNNLWVALLTVVWIAPNAMMALFLSNLSNLGLVWPAFNTELRKNPKVWSAVQGIASPALTSLIYLILPIIFRRLSIRAGDTTKTSREKHVVHKLYAFFVFNNLFIFSLFSAIWSYIATVVDKSRGKNALQAIEEGRFGDTVFTALCNVSPFWVTWLLQRSLGAAIDISQLYNLMVIGFAKTFMNPTPRQLIEWTAPPPFDYASYYNYFLFYATVALCFATLQPIVLPVTAFYFSLDSWLKKYLLMYVFVTKTESGGKFWRILFNRIIFATILANVVVGLAAFVRGSNRWLMLGVMVPAPLFMLLFKWYCRRTFDDKIQYYATSISEDTERLAVSSFDPKKKLEQKFMHPALTKTLITPMVHAKGQGILETVYKRPNGNENGMYSSQSGMQLQTMSATSQGKPLEASRADLEVVPEHRLDFAYFKHREEFGEDHGAGEIYGKPSDLISERSQTPLSMFGGPNSSRTASPVGFGRRPVPYRPGVARDHPAYSGGGSADRSDSMSSRGRVRNYQGENGFEYPSAYSRSESESRLLAHAGGNPVSASGGRADSLGGSSRHGYDNISVEPTQDPTSYDYYRHGR